MDMSSDLSGEELTEKHIIIISYLGEIQYDELLTYENAETFEEYPRLQEGVPVGRSPNSKDQIEGNLGGAIVYGLASAPSIAAFAGLIKTYITRHKARSVVISWKDGYKATIKIEGDFSTKEIEALLRSEIDKGSG
jgi:hypothetical protein